jgi:alpha-ribazole phosphatase
MHARVVECFNRIVASPRPLAIVTHGGVIRSILSHVTATPLKDSFGAFGISYGCVIRLDGMSDYEVLHSIVTEKEQHKPQRFDHSK